VKLSRKFAEHNVFTQIKALYILHLVSEKVEEKAKTVWRNAVLSLRDEFDEKLGQNYFAAESVNSSLSSLTTVQELNAAEFLRYYSDYLFHFMEYQQKKITKQISSSVPDTSNDLSYLLEGIKKIRSMTSDLAVLQWTTELIINDEKDILFELTTMYEKNYQQIRKVDKSGKSEDDLIRLIQHFIPNYPKMVSDSVAKKKIVSAQSKKVEVLKKIMVSKEMEGRISSSKQISKPPPKSVAPSKQKLTIPKVLDDSVRKSVRQPAIKEKVVIPPVLKFVKSSTPRKKFEEGKGLSTLFSSVSSSLNLPSFSSLSLNKKPNQASNKKSVIDATKKSAKIEKKSSK
jgi:hypothetical protein